MSTYLIPPPATTIIDAVDGAEAMFLQGFAFNPDTYGAEYVERASGERSLTDAQATAYDAFVESMYRVCSDPHEVTNIAEALAKRAW